MAPNAFSNTLPNLNGDDYEDWEMQFHDDEDNKSTITEEESLLEDLENYADDGAAKYGNGEEWLGLVPNEMLFPHGDQPKKQLPVEVPQNETFGADPAFDIVMDVDEPNEGAATSADIFVELNDMFGNLHEFDEDFFDGAAGMDF